MAKEFQKFRVRMSAKWEKFYVGELKIPTAAMKRPLHQAASRSYNEQHTQALVEEMYNVGFPFPIEPCVFNVRF